MCGRNSLYATKNRLKNRYSASMERRWSKKYNIAPGDHQPVVTKDSTRSLELKQWKFVPSFVESEKERKKWMRKNIINARTETVRDRETFKQSFKKNKCLIPSTGFYEWKDEGKSRKTPYHVQPAEGDIFSFAGCYYNETYVVLTKPAQNPDMRELHRRVPVIIERNLEGKYLNNDLGAEELLDMQTQELDISQASTQVNDPNNDSREVLNPATTQSNLSDIVYRT